MSKKSSQLTAGVSDPNPTRDRTFILTEPEQKRVHGVASGAVEPIDPFSWNVALTMHKEDPSHTVQEYYDAL